MGYAYCGVTPLGFVFVVHIGCSKMLEAKIRVCLVSGKSQQNACCARGSKVVSSLVSGS